jgi:TonB family protein
VTMWVSNEGVTHWPRATMSLSAAVIMVCVLSAVAVGQAQLLVEGHAVGVIDLDSQRFASDPKIPRKIKDVKPVYPSESLQAGDEGVILLELKVTPSGTVGQVRILWSECKRLEQAALTAARQWRFTQLTVNGKPAPFTVLTDVPFRLPARFKERAGRSSACKWKEPPRPTH